MKKIEINYKRSTMKDMWNVSSRFHNSHEFMCMLDYTIRNVKLHYNSTIRNVILYYKLYNLKCKFVL